MKQLKEIVKELDEIERAGKFTEEQCAALCADIQAIQQKIEREKITLSKGYSYKLEESEQRIFVLLHSLSDKSQNHARRDARALKFVYICMGLLSLLICIVVISIGAISNMIERNGLITSTILIVWGLMSVINYSFSYMILNRSFDSFLRTMALLWLPLGVWASYDKFMSHDWLWCAIYSLAVMCLIMLSRYPQGSQVFWRLIAGLGLVTCALICSNAMGLNDNTEILYFCVTVSLMPVLLLMLLVNIDFRLFLYSALSLGLGVYVLFTGEIKFAKSDFSFLSTRDENPIRYWGVFALYFLGWLLLTYMSYKDFFGRLRVHEEPLDVINKSQK